MYILSLFFNDAYSKLFKAMWYFPFDFSGTYLSFNFAGLSKLFSVSQLHLDDNYISSLNEIAHLRKLPCIEVLNMQGNPITLNVDYRSQALLLFGSRASEVLYIIIIVY